MLYRNAECYMKKEHEDNAQFSAHFFLSSISIFISKRTNIKLTFITVQERISCDLLLIEIFFFVTAGCQK